MTPEPELLAEIQEAASVAALGHIYGGVPFPREEVLERWRTSTDTILLDDEELGFAAVSPGWLNGLYVRPEAWGTGVAARLHERALAALGPGIARLWVLEENHRARRFYERRGWREDGTTRDVPFPPYPIDLGYSLEIR
ncbi:MAG TPA: GNAT family N-acetyltransferase [Gaiellaceae bacterium]|nr:GNAT family N-acetyltransferase [Gaiellaceae bacterium]